jgi:hypothetical protein
MRIAVSRSLPAPSLAKVCRLKDMRGSLASCVVSLFAHCGTRNAPRSAAIGHRLPRPLCSVRPDVGVDLHNFSPAPELLSRPLAQGASGGSARRRTAASKKSEATRRPPHEMKDEFALVYGRCCSPERLVSPLSHLTSIEESFVLPFAFLKITVCRVFLSGGRPWYSKRRRGGDAWMFIVKASPRSSPRRDSITPMPERRTMTPTRKPTAKRRAPMSSHLLAERCAVALQIQPP